MSDLKKTKMSDEELRNHVRNLREFYTNFSMYAGVNAALFVIWVITGAGAFWPFWTIFFWGIALAIQAMNSGLFTSECQEWTQKVLNFLPFLKKSWEDDQVKKMSKCDMGKCDMDKCDMDKGSKGTKASEAAASTPVKTASKPAAPKAPVKKAPAKKATPAQKPAPKAEAKPPVGKIYE